MFSTSSLDNNSDYVSKIFRIVLITIVLAFVVAVIVWGICWIVKKVKESRKPKETFVFIQDASELMSSQGTVSLGLNFAKVYLSGLIGMNSLVGASDNADIGVAQITQVVNNGKVTSTETPESAESFISKFKTTFRIK